MQRARCYLIGETAVVLELEPPVTLASQKRIWRLAQRLVDMPNVVEAIPGMNNITVILRNPESLALDAIERLQRWWEESEALEQTLEMVQHGRVKSITGEWATVTAQTVCLHGDGEHALAFARRLRSTFAEKGIVVAA